MVLQLGGFSTPPVITSSIKPAQWTPIMEMVRVSLIVRIVVMI